MDSNSGPSHPSSPIAPFETPPNTTNESMDTSVDNSPNNEADQVAQDEENAKTAKENLEKNEDYRAVVKTLDVLRHQLKQALQDIESLHKLKKEALGDPFEFVAYLKQKDSRRRIPQLQKIVCVPDIDWRQYKYLPDSRLVQQAAALNALSQHSIGLHKPSVFRNILEIPYHPPPPSHPTSSAVRSMQRELNKASQILTQMPSRANSVSDFSDKESDDESMVQPSRYGKGMSKRRASVHQPKVEEPTAPLYRNIMAEDYNDKCQPSDYPTYSRANTPESTRQTLRYIEPRMSEELSLDSDDRSKLPTHNQPWSDEEQQRLEQLLEIYPDEPVQAQRFNKISSALGTRTARQVASRVQKYFIKLAKLGLPVPGRITIPPSCLPKPSRGSINGRGRGIGRIMKPKRQNSSNKPRSVARQPVRTSGSGYNSMVSGGITTTRISGAHYLTAQAPPTVFMSDDDDDDTTVKNMMLKVTNQKIRNGDSSIKEENTNEAVHEGYACDNCGIEPIVGVLYKCTVCDVSEEIDLCGQCMSIGTFSNDHHTPDHPFEAIRTPNALPYYADNDYASPEYLGEYSYLGY
ncbi:Homeodomain-like DNA binding domain-containing transcription factor [Phycomyces blakesleeanus]